MEIMDITQLFGGIYKNKTILVTGDTGFKGSWLVFWLLKMEAKVIGFSLEPYTTPNHFTLLGCAYTSVRGNINNPDDLEKVFNTYQPEIVFHLAAQSLVRYSYDHPIETLKTNIMGTANVFEISRKTASVRAVVNVTSDKCYDNKEWLWGYRENDPMGGHDPYSASKGCAELITASYQNSFFNTKDKLLASVRAGNVIGGGDWAQDRLIPDMVKAAGNNETVTIRNPLATRPWQHVLDPLSGYLMLGWYLLEGKEDYADGWNFGPSLNSNVTVKTLLEKASGFWNKIEYQDITNKSDYHEANLLMLDCSKATKLLKWSPVWDFDTAIKKTIEWYKDFYENNQLITNVDLESYIFTAKAQNVVWTQ
jgi:CDP-glucose 4,6-dehydratase